MIGLGKYPSSEVHPDDPINRIPTIQTEFRQRVKNDPFQPILNGYPKTFFLEVRYEIVTGINSTFGLIIVWKKKNGDLAFYFPCRMYTRSSGINIGRTELLYSKSGFKN